LSRFLLATLLARLLLSAVALLAALILLAWLLFVGVHNCSFVSSLSTTKPRPLSFPWMWTLGFGYDEGPHADTRLAMHPRGRDDRLGQEVGSGARSVMI
jgi:hypothetical protein